MREPEILTLRLAAPLPYRGIENPPFPGVPDEPSRLLGPLDPGPPGGEGGEELFAFDPGELVAFDPDEGPRVAHPLPAPRFYGRAPDAPAGEEEGAPRRLEAGLYRFMQFRLEGPEEERDAEIAGWLEHFARETWWEGAPCRGPYFLRRLREDGKLALQAIRALDGGAPERRG